MVQDFADFHLTLQQIFLWHSDRGFGISQVIPNLGWVVAQSFSFLLYMEHHHNQQWVVVFVDYQRLTTFKGKMQCTYIYIYCKLVDFELPCLIARGSFPFSYPSP
jgi:hypothetical protein